MQGPHAAKLAVPLARTLSGAAPAQGARSEEPTQSVWARAPGLAQRRRGFSKIPFRSDHSGASSPRPADPPTTLTKKYFRAMRSLGISKELKSPIFLAVLISHTPSQVAQGNPGPRPAQSKFRGTQKLILPSWKRVSRFAEDDLATARCSHAQPPWIHFYALEKGQQRVSSLVRATDGEAQQTALTDSQAPARSEPQRLGQRAPGVS